MAGAVTSSSNSASAAALDALEETFNSLLLQIGSAFHNLPDAGQGPRPDNRHLTRCNAHMKQFVPQALSQFQDNLDDLESELVRAQQTIRRDLLLSRIKPEPAKVTTPAATTEATSVVVSTEGAAAATSPPTNDKGHEQESGHGVQSDTKPGATTHEQGPPSATSDDGLDAMFNDLTNPNPTSGADESKAEENATSATISDNKQNNKGETEANVATTQDSNHDDTDVSSLLPGLESYANDNALPDFPAGDFDGDLGGDNGFGGGDDFNFDDLIQGFGGGGADGDGNTNGDATMTDFNQFDDDFFNIDGSAT